MTRTDTLGAGATRRYDNVVEQLFGVSGVGGAVRVRANQEVFVSSRTYDRPSGAELKDVKGLFFSGIPASLAIGSGEVSRLQGVSNGPVESYRYNFGLVETTGQPVTVTVRLRNEDGGVTHTQLYDLGAYEARQVNAFAGFTPDVSVSDALLEAQVGAGAGKVLFYGTQIAGTATNPGSNDSAGFEMSFRSLLAAGGVPSVNGITSAVTITGSGATTVTTNGGTITVSSSGGSGGGLTLPYSGTAATGGTAFAIANSSTGMGIQANAVSSPAVYGVSTNSRGVFGEGGAYGVYGQSANEGVHGQGAVGVYGLGQGSAGTGVYGIQGSASAVSPSFSSGVHGDSSLGPGVLGSSDTGYGVMGLSANFYGVYGEAKNSGGSGVFGQGQGAAVGAAGSSLSGIGVDGISLGSRPGVRGTSQSGEGVSGQAMGVNTGAGVLGANDAGGIGIGVYGRAKANGNRAGYFDGGITVVNGAKSFVEPHPTDPTKQIRFAALEGPESGTYFRGTGRTLNGTATIEVPEAFRMVTDETGLTVVVTPVGELALIACVKFSLTEILIQSSRDVDFHYMVNGVRKSLAEMEPIEENTFFVPTSPTDPVLTRPLPKETVARLISNGTLNRDGTINMNTVQRLGWDKRDGWKEREPTPAEAKAPGRPQ